MTYNHAGLVAMQASSAQALVADTIDLRTDATIEQDLRAILAEPAFAQTAVTISVHGGIVTLDGVVSDGLSFARLKNRITSAAPSLSMADRVDWVVPECGVGVA